MTPEQIINKYLCPRALRFVNDVMNEYMAYATNCHLGRIHSSFVRRDEIRYRLVSMAIRKFQSEQTQ